MFTCWGALPGELKAAIAACLARRTDRLHLALASKECLEHSHAAITRLQITDLRAAARRPPLLHFPRARLLRLVPAAAEDDPAAQPTDVLVRFLAAHRGWLANVQDVTIHGKLEQPAAAIALLSSQLPSLRSLSVSVPGCGALGQALGSCLPQLRRLQRLSLGVGGVGSAPLPAALAELPALERLDIGGAVDGGACLASLGRLSTLTSLWLSTDGFSAASDAQAINQVAQLTRLQHLDCYWLDSRDPALDLSRWSSLVNLQELHTYSLPAHMVAVLAKLPSLRSLHLVELDLADVQGLAALQLTHLDVHSLESSGAAPPAARGSGQDQQRQHRLQHLLGAVPALLQPQRPHQPGGGPGGRGGAAPAHQAAALEATSAPPSSHHPAWRLLPRRGGAGGPPHQPPAAPASSCSS